MAARSQTGHPADQRQSPRRLGASTAGLSDTPMCGTKSIKSMLGCRVSRLGSSPSGAHPRVSKTVGLGTQCLGWEVAFCPTHHSGSRWASAPSSAGALHCHPTVMASAVPAAKPRACSPTPAASLPPAGSTGCAIYLGSFEVGPWLTGRGLSGQRPLPVCPGQH